MLQALRKSSAWHSVQRCSQQPPGKRTRCSCLRRQEGGRNCPSCPSDPPSLPSGPQPPLLPRPAHLRACHFRLEGAPRPLQAVAESPLPPLSHSQAPPQASHSQLVPLSHPPDSAHPSAETARAGSWCSTAHLPDPSSPWQGLSCSRFLWSSPLFSSKHLPNQTELSFVSQARRLSCPPRLWPCPTRIRPSSSPAPVDQSPSKRPLPCPSREPSPTASFLSWPSGSCIFSAALQVCRERSQLPSPRTSSPPASCSSPCSPP
mmetsp:Transcript_3457/g.9707  ORF Transcript_3457/g.9707 Transcript_3457/m.9707 type:complete len:261 (+) Transcript_3457:3048-3830(+)